MRLTHRQPVWFAKHLLISIAASALVTVADIWHPMRAIIGVACAIACIYLAAYSVRAYGILNGRSWARNMALEHLDGTIVDFLVCCGFVVLGVVAAWPT